MRISSRTTPRPTTTSPDHLAHSRVSPTGPTARLSPHACRPVAETGASAPLEPNHTRASQLHNNARLFRLAPSQLPLINLVLLLQKEKCRLLDGVVDEPHLLLGVVGKADEGLELQRRVVQLRGDPHEVLVGRDGARDEGKEQQLPPTLDLEVRGDVNDVILKLLERTVDYAKVHASDPRVLCVWVQHVRLEAALDLPVADVLGRCGHAVAVVVGRVGLDEGRDDHPLAGAHDPNKHTRPPLPLLKVEEDRLVGNSAFHCRTGVFLEMPVFQ